MRLWPEEYEELRDEARRVVAQSMAAVAAVYETDPEAAAAAGDLAGQRAAIARTYVTVPEAVEREIAGIRCLEFHDARDHAPSGVYLHFHGGGMTMGAPEMSSLRNLDLHRRIGLTVVSVDYRVAPEHPYPAGPDDGLTVARWLLEEGLAEYGADRIVVGGESAGGYMAAAVLLRIRDALGVDALARVVGANLVCGVYDWGMTPSQRGVRAYDGPDLLSPAGIASCVAAYLPGMTPEECRAPAVSPAHADLRGMPPAFFSVGSCDHLLDDSIVLAGRWAAVNDVELFVAPDLPHGFSNFPCTIVDRWNEQFDAWLARVLGR